MTAHLDFLVYRSFATVPSDLSPDIASILMQSLRNNPKWDVTGFLHYERGRFYQYVEGPRPSLDHLMGKLRQDPRHGDLDLRGSGTTPNRLFAGFDMGFASATGRHLRASGAPTWDRPDAEEITRFLLCLQAEAQATRMEER